MAHESIETSTNPETEQEYQAEDMVGKIMKVNGLGSITDGGKRIVAELVSFHPRSQSPAWERETPCPPFPRGGICQGRPGGSPL